MIKGAIPVKVDKETGRLIIDKKLVYEMREEGKEVNDVLHGKQLTEDDDIFGMIKKHTEEMVTKLEHIRLCWLSEMWSWDKIYPFVKQRMISHYYNEIRDYKFTTEDINCDNEYNSPFNKLFNKRKREIDHVNKINEIITNLHKEAKGSDINKYTDYFRTLILSDKSEIENLHMTKMWVSDELYNLNMIRGYQLRDISECPFYHGRTIYKQRLEREDI